MKKHQHTSTEGKEGRQQHTLGPWKIGDHIWGVNESNRSLAVWPEPHGKNPICLVSPKEAETETDYANAILIASAPTLKAENESLKLEVERLKRNKETAMLLALEFGYKQCEKGENLDGAFLNYNKLTQP